MLLYILYLIHVQCIVYTLLTGAVYRLDVTYCRRQQALMNSDIVLREIYGKIKLGFEAKIF